MKYIINTETNIITLDEGNLGANFRKPPHRPATQEEVDNYDLKKLKASKISTCKAYLTSKDWYAIRGIDIPNSYPQSIKDARTAARMAINDLEKLNTLEEVQNYDISKFE